MKISPAEPLPVSRWWVSWVSSKNPRLRSFSAILWIAVLLTVLMSALGDGELRERDLGGLGVLKEQDDLGDDEGRSDGTVFRVLEEKVGW